MFYCEKIEGSLERRAFVVVVDVVLNFIYERESEGAHTSGGGAEGKGDEDSSLNREPCEGLQDSGIMTRAKCR